MTGLAAIGEGLVELTLGRDPYVGVVGFGGDAPNVCVMARRLETPAKLLGRVGDDSLGLRLLEFWREQRLELEHVTVDAAAPTGMYVNEVDRRQDHRFLYWRRGSAGSLLRPSDLAETFLDGVGMLVVTGVTFAISSTAAATAHKAMAAARRRGVGVACVLNHRPTLGGDVDELRKVASASDVVIGSREECELLYGDPRPRIGLKETAITDGARPAYVIWQSGDATQAPPNVKTQNAAGAGDAFAGAYLASRLAGRLPSLALRWAVSAASLSIRTAGCALSYPTYAQTLATLRSLTSDNVRMVEGRQ